MFVYRLSKIERLTVTRGSTVAIKEDGLTIVLVEKGEGEIRYGNSILDFGPESVIVLPADKESTFATSDYIPMYVNILVVMKERVMLPMISLTKITDRKLDTLSHDDVMFYDISSDDYFAFFNLYKIIETEFTKRESFSNFILDGLIISLLMMLSRRISFADFLKYEQSDLGDVSIGESVLQAIRSGYGEPMTLESLAKRLGFSVPYLSRTITKELGASFSELLTTARIGTACDMLKDTNNLVYDIAQACGYNNLSHFCYAFKKARGVSPLTFRNNQRRAKHAFD
jgi:AraC-like DNA-binding protein